MLLEHKTISIKPIPYPPAIGEIFWLKFLYGEFEIKKEGLLESVSLPKEELKLFSRYDILLGKTDVPVAQLDRVSGFEPEGSGFKSLQAQNIPS